MLSHFRTSRVTTDNPFTDYSPYLNSIFKATLTQHLLQGAGIWMNKRFIYQALNDRRIADSSFRQQILYTVNQVENIYWGLVQAYEDVQAKERALEQSQQLLADNKKQLEIGSMAPLDVVNAESSVAADQQALISSQSALNYQQQIIKQAIARNLNDATLSAAPGHSHRPREPGGDSRGNASPWKRWCRKPFSAGRNWNRRCSRCATTRSR